MATISLKAKAEAEEALPTLDRSKHYGEVGGVQGVKFVQGNAYFRANGDFHSYTGPGEELTPETREAEILRKQKEAKDNVKWGRVPKRGGAPELPKKVIEASRENARALAAEAQAS